MKNIIITGTSRGIGYELALQFANAGHQVLAISRKTPEALIENPNILPLEHFPCLVLKKVYTFFVNPDTNLHLFLILKYIYNSFFLIKFLVLLLFYIFLLILHYGKVKPRSSGNPFAWVFNKSKKL